MQSKVKCLFWTIPLVFHASEANAWGLMTHLYFAHSLLWAMPLLDPRLRAAIQKFPELVMAGACLPDLAIISKKHRDTHDWQHAHILLESANSEEELAIAIGYASHLYVDVIAHNHFVPAHEEMWIDRGMLAHVASEWAMDAHLAPLLEASPGRLLRRHANQLAKFIAPHFGCCGTETKKLILKLSFWDDTLRVFKIPSLIYQVSRLADKRVHTHFIYYIAKTQVAIADIGLVLTGTTPEWEAELLHLNTEQLSMWRLDCLGDLALLHPSPIRHFAPNSREKALAIQT
jgi:hypothetical protein